MQRALRLTVFAASLAVITACGDTNQQDEPVVVVDQDAGSSSDTDSPQHDGSDAETDEPTPGEGIAALGDGHGTLDAVELAVIADDSHALAGPRDLAFNPDAPDQLWVVNQGDNSVVVLFDAGTDAQTHQRYKSGGSDHFLAKPAALAFGQPGHMATAQQENEVTQPSTPEDFMGPTLWATDLEHFDAGHGSHLDMLHNSPLASGIAWDDGNAYWIFDGHHGSITYYDFQDDHGMGGSDHSDGVIRRYVDGQVGVVPGVVAHVDLDRDTGLLYIADTGNNRVAVLDTNSGEEGSILFGSYDRADQRRIENADMQTLVEGSEAGLSQPAGLELHDGHLYVGDNGSSTIYAFDLDGALVDRLDLSEHITPGGMMGLALDAHGNVYVADGEDDAILRLSPSQE